MQLVDANVLLHAANKGSRQHEQAYSWLAQALGGAETLAFTWLVALAFLRVATNRSVFERPLPPDRAIAVLEAWLAAPASVIVEPTRQHVTLLGGLLVRAGTAGNLVNDAHLAAIALEHNATVVSFDRDFGRFEGVRVKVPGAGAR